jgi:hypothetical protein
MIIREPRTASSRLRCRSEKNSFSNASWLSVRISSWVIIREPPNRVKWAKASIRKKHFEVKSGRVGSGRVSNLELVDNKRAPNSRVGKGVDQKKNFEFKSGRVGSGRVSNLELVDNERAPNSRVGKGVDRKKNFEFKSGRVGSGFESRAG